MTDDRLVIEENDRAVIITPTDDEVIGSQENLVVITQDVLEYVVDSTSINVPPTGDYQTSINTDNSVNAIVVTTGGGTGGNNGGVLWP